MNRAVWRVSAGQGGLVRHNGITSNNLLEEDEKFIVSWSPEYFFQWQSSFLEWPHFSPTWGSMRAAQSEFLWCKGHSSWGSSSLETWHSGIQLMTYAKQLLRLHPLKWLEAVSYAFVFFLYCDMNQILTIHDKLIRNTGMDPFSLSAPSHSLYQPCKGKAKWKICTVRE